MLVSRIRGFFAATDITHSAASGCSSWAGRIGKQAAGILSLFLLLGKCLDKESLRYCARTYRNNP